MKEDYLWDKTGGDAEIAKLEDALTVFRHQPGSAPPFAIVIPAAKTVSKPSWVVWLRLAFAASAAAVIAASVWMWAAQEREVFEVKNDAALDARRTAKPRSETIVTAPVDEIDRSTGAAQEPNEPAYTSAAAVRRKQQRKKSSRETAKTVPKALTSEEKYAYDRLMLALSITGSKLKIVRDTIDGNGTEDGKQGSGKR